MSERQVCCLRDLSQAAVHNATTEDIQALHVHQDDKPFCLDKSPMFSWALEILSSFSPSSAFLSLPRPLDLPCPPPPLPTPPPLALRGTLIVSTRQCHQQAHHALSRPGLENVPTHQPRNITHPLMCTFCPRVWSEEKGMGVMH